MNLSPSHRFRARLLAGLAITLLAGTTLRAAEDSHNLAGNIATANNGAYIIYSAPLKNGGSANFLTQDFSHKLSFANHSGPMLFVLDLGKTYALGAVDLKFKNPVKFEIFVVGDKPDSGDWESLLGGHPDFISDTPGFDAALNGQKGRYIIFVAASDPGPFYHLYVTGVFLPHPNGTEEFAGIYSHDGDNDHSGGSGPVGEPPIPRGDYNPPVTNPSP